MNILDGENMLNINDSDLKNDLSSERLDSFKINSNDSLEILLIRYLKNIKIAESFYPAIALLEITLRNHINNAINKNIKVDWLLEELSASTPTILLPFEYSLLQEAKQRITKPIFKSDGTRTIPTPTMGKLIADLNFGFWVNLCNPRRYSPNIWMKKPTIFDDVFPYYDSLIAQKNPNAKRHKRINKVSLKLKSILNLRNRIFHHEPILKNLQDLSNCYSEIEEVLFYMSMETGQHLLEISNFHEYWRKINKSH